MQEVVLEALAAYNVEPDVGCKCIISYPALSYR